MQSFLYVFCTLPLVQALRHSATAVLTRGEDHMCIYKCGCPLASTGGCMHQAAILQYVTAWCLVLGCLLPDEKRLKSPETCLFVCACWSTCASLVLAPVFIMLVLIPLPMPALSPCWASVASHKLFPSVSQANVGCCKVS